MTQFSPSTLSIQQSLMPLPTPERTALLENPGFGRAFSDHMVTIRYTEGRGWHDGKVEARGMLPLDPSTMVLHYAQEIFEGMKAYPQPDGGAALFRPEANARRFQKSATRLAMAPLPEELFLESVHALVNADRDWIPQAEGSALYLRPFMIATEAALGVRPANEYLFCVFASPAGNYFKGGAAGVTLWVSENYIRAAPGGTGTSSRMGRSGQVWV